MRKSTPEDFWNKVSKTDGCWEWTGCKMKTGFPYGMVMYQGRKLLAHRCAAELAIGEIPKGMCVCHKCDNPTCVNPDHLFFGTHKDNVGDCVEKGRRADYKGETHHKAKLTESQVQSIRTRYESGGVRQQDLSDEYGVSRTMIGYIVRRQMWKHLP